MRGLSRNVSSDLAELLPRSESSLQILKHRLRIWRLVIADRRVCEAAGGDTCSQQFLEQRLFRHVGATIKWIQKHDISRSIGPTDEKVSRKADAVELQAIASPELDEQHRQRDWESRPAIQNLVQIGISRIE